VRTQTIDKATRQASFNTLLPRAIADARESGEAIQIIFAPIYSDEHDDSVVHVYCPKIAVDLLAKRHAWMTDDDYEVDATIQPNGSILYNAKVCEKL
jgi:hypothetical protein